MKDRHHVQDYLLALLLDLGGIQQNPIYHPEGDALFHSLQVFQHALNQCNDPNLLAAALFHDVGKVYGCHNHELMGAEMLSCIFNNEIVWLIKHHLDLLKSPVRTKRRLKHEQNKLYQLQQLRKWDLAGRDPLANVISAEEAIYILTPHLHKISVS